MPLLNQISESKKRNLIQIFKMYDCFDYLTYIIKTIIDFCKNVLTLLIRILKIRYNNVTTSSKRSSSNKEKFRTAHRWGCIGITSRSALYVNVLFKQGRLVGTYSINYSRTLLTQHSNMCLLW